ncbi:MAG: glycosyltransferase family 8 protein [Cyanobacteriota bacterium]
MNIVCATDGNYLSHCTVMLQSLCLHVKDPKSLRVFLIIDNVSPDIFAKSISHLYQILPSLSILRADSAPLAHFPVTGHASIATYFRLLLPGLLPAELQRVIFIDADTVVTASLDELWQLPLEGKALAALKIPFKNVDDIYQLGDYFNAGVMLIDLDRWRQADVLQRGGDFARANPQSLRYWDQDVLNHLFHRDWLPFKDRWNACPHLFGLFPAFSLDPHDLTAAEQEAITDPAIVHFAGGGWMVKPWNARCRHPLRHHYLQARSLTPWASDPLEDAPPAKWRQRVDQALFHAKCQARRLIPSA